MIHLNVISDAATSVSDEFQIRATGRYYTHEKIAQHTINALIKSLISQSTIPNKIKVADPFSGDGRLIYWLIQQWDSSDLPPVEWEVTLWDINNQGLIEAEEMLNSLKHKNIKIKKTIKSGDSFKLASFHQNKFDIVITNPPWELLKPDVRELMELDDMSKKQYISSMREYDIYLASQFPLSQPIKKFAGWGTNLSRVGAEVSHLICKDGGYIGIVLPASFFADEQSTNIRSHILKNNLLIDIAYYPAEAKLFGKADVSSSSFVYRKNLTLSKKVNISTYDKSLKLKTSNSFNLSSDNSFMAGHIIPITLGSEAIKTLEKMTFDLPTWKMSEEAVTDGLWSGRELDETGSESWLSTEGKGPKFVKGKMIDRYKLIHEPKQFVNKKGWKSFPSCNFERIVWRDVSRPNQKRRVIATIIPAGVVCGNSLGVTYYKNSDSNALRILLGVMNSLCFEFQLRCHLATGHISLSAIRKVCLPTRDSLRKNKVLLELVEQCLNGIDSALPKVEAIVARDVFNLSESDLVILMNSFEKLTSDEKDQIVSAYRTIPKNFAAESQNEIELSKLHNHFSSKLSKLDMTIVHSVPPGGNWKNIPKNVPSKRIEQIRESYAEGKGSRSTYYGRLMPNKPAYTINTYFNRPGNGCHIHYEQDRVLSQREAARLQSFPDNFIFYGSQTAVNTQIGNAVPPLLAYQIALEVTKAIGQTGGFIDLFSGAGGLGLGFKWAGWKPLLANDIEPRFLETYSKNIHSNVLVGSIANESVFLSMVKEAKAAKKNNPKKPFWILGGPPCQGFSTAGNKRSMEDERNSLFINYKEFIKEVVPDGFVFENVAGLLSMDRGAVFSQIKSSFKSVIPHLTGWVLNSENYAIPQRRKRVILVGSHHADFHIIQPDPLTSLEPSKDLFKTLKASISVADAISDLPSLSQGQDGSDLNYRCPPTTDYQKLMRGLLSPKQYLDRYR